jgi:hypothetical protein
VLAHPLLISTLFEVYNEVLGSYSDAHCDTKQVAVLVCKSRGAFFVVHDENRFISHYDDAVFLEKHESICSYSCSA